MRLIPFVFSISLVLLTAPVSLWAGFKIPKEVYSIDGLEAAKSEALAKKKPMAFLFSDANTTCPLCENASIHAIKALKQETVMVYLNAKVPTEWNVIPKIVQGGIYSAESGKFLPKTIIVNSDLSKVIDIVPYSRDEKERARFFREAEKKIRSENAIAVHPSSSPSESNPTASASKTITCSQEIEAFDVSNPSNLIGTFKAGTSLTIDSEYRETGMLLVIYKPSDGNELRALCRAQDLK